MSRHEMRQEMRQQLQAELHQLQSALQAKLLQKQKSRHGGEKSCGASRAKKEDVQEQEEQYQALLEKRKMISWCHDASHLVPVKATTNASSIVEAVSTGVMGRIDEVFCTQLLRYMAELLQAGRRAEQSERTISIQCYRRWRSEYIQEHGEDSHDMARKWQSVVNFEPLQNLECERVYLMAIAYLLGTCIMVYDATDEEGPEGFVSRGSTSASPNVLKWSKTGLYLPFGNKRAQQQKRMMCVAFTGKDCCYLQPQPNSSSKNAPDIVVVPLVTKDATLFPVRLLLPDEECSQLLPVYLNMVSHGKFHDDAGTPILCAHMQPEHTPQKLAIENLLHAAKKTARSVLAAVAAGRDSPHIGRSSSQEKIRRGKAAFSERTIFVSRSSSPDARPTEEPKARGRSRRRSIDKPNQESQELLTESLDDLFASQATVPSSTEDHAIMLEAASPLPLGGGGRATRMRKSDSDDALSKRVLEGAHATNSEGSMLPRSSSADALHGSDDSISADPLYQRILHFSLKGDPKPHGVLRRKMSMVRQQSLRGFTDETIYIRRTGTPPRRSREGEGTARDHGLEDDDAMLNDAPASSRVTWGPEETLRYEVHDRYDQ